MYLLPLVIKCQYTPKFGFLLKPENRKTPLGDTFMGDYPRVELGFLRITRSS